MLFCGASPHAVHVDVARGTPGEWREPQRVHPQWQEVAGPPDRLLNRSDAGLKIRKNMIETPENLQVLANFRDLARPELGDHADRLPAVLVQSLDAIHEPQVEGVAAEDKEEIVLLVRADSAVDQSFPSEYLFNFSAD